MVKLTKVLQASAKVVLACSIAGYSILLASGFLKPDVETILILMGIVVLLLS